MRQKFPFFIEREFHSKRILSIFTFNSSDKVQIVLTRSNRLHTVIRRIIKIIKGKKCPARDRDRKFIPSGGEVIKEQISDLDPHRDSTTPLNNEIKGDGSSNGMLPSTHSRKEPLANTPKVFSIVKVRKSVDRILAKNPDHANYRTCIL